MEFLLHPHSLHQRLHMLLSASCRVSLAYLYRETEQLPAQQQAVAANHCSVYANSAGVAHCLLGTLSFPVEPAVVPSNQLVVSTPVTWQSHQAVCRCATRN